MYCINLKEYSILIFYSFFHIYFEFCTSLHCVLCVMRGNRKSYIMDNGWNTIDSNWLHHIHFIKQFIKIC